MYPHERSLVEQLNDKPFALIGVNSDSDLDEVRETIKENKLAWRSFQNKREGQKPISEIWQVRGWPTMYILDGTGKIRFANIKRDKIDAAITELLSEMGHEVDLKHLDED